MKQRFRSTLLVLSMAAFAVAGSGCKRSESGSGQAMDAASSGVMSNSAAPNGTDNSDAAQRANASAGAAASGTQAAGSEPAVNSSPPTQASGSQ